MIHNLAMPFVWRETNEGIFGYSVGAQWPGNPRVHRKGHAGRSGYNDDRGK